VPVLAGVVGDDAPLTARSLTIDPARRSTVSSVIFDMSMSLDGFARDTNPRRETPLGDGGEALHTWAMDERDAAGRDVLEHGIADTGAVISGRVTYDDSVPWWQADGPTGPLGCPSSCSRTPPLPIPRRTVFVVVTTGIHDGLARAKEAADGRNVTIMGGPAVGNQYLRAGLVDELSIHLVPVLFGSGTRLTEALPAHVELEPTAHRPTSHALHLRYRIVRMP
jgi:dihydrofolate reductase